MDLEDFTKVYLYHIWAWQPSWSCDQHHVNQFSFPCPQKSTYKIWLKMAQWCLRKASYFLHDNNLGPRSRNDLDLQYSLSFTELVVCIYKISGHWQVSWKSARRFRRIFLKGFYHIWAWRQPWSKQGVLEKKMFEIVDDDVRRRQTDAGSWVYYKLTYEPSAQVS